MSKHILCGFGFGPIGAGLFAREAFKSGNFSRLVVADIDAELVEAVRANNGGYYVNVAGADGIELVKVDGLELLNPKLEPDRHKLFEVLKQSTEIVTALPSVNFYDAGSGDSVADVTARALSAHGAEATIIYTAENNNRAAEILEQAVSARTAKPLHRPVQFLNTVIARMSRVVTGPAEIARLQLTPIAPGIERAFLVEQFNRILVTKTTLKGFRPGIDSFVEKDDLLPFAQAKLYGHNTIHALLGFVGAVKGYEKLSRVASDEAMMEMGRKAFLNESGAALAKKYGYLGDELFTDRPFDAYAEDLLRRITNPYLADTTARASRDVVRKLGMNDRIFGTMRLALKYGIEPVNLAVGALAGIELLLRQADDYGLDAELRFGDWHRLDAQKIEGILDWIWAAQDTDSSRDIIKCVADARRHLGGIVD